MQNSVELSKFPRLCKMAELFIPPSQDFIDFLMYEVLKTTPEIFDQIMTKFNIRDNHTLLMSTHNSTDNTIRTKSGVVMTVDIRAGGYMNSDTKCTLNLESGGNYTTECLVVRNDEELDQIKQIVNESNPSKGLDLSGLDFGSLSALINHGGLTAFDVINLSGTTKELNRLSKVDNNALFRIFLTRDFGVAIFEKDAKCQYIKTLYDACSSSKEKYIKWGTEFDDMIYWNVYDVFSFLYNVGDHVIGYIHEVMSYSRPPTNIHRLYFEVIREYSLFEGDPDVMRQFIDQFDVDYTKIVSENIDNVIDDMYIDCDFKNYILFDEFLAVIRNYERDFHDYYIQNTGNDAISAAISVEEYKFEQFFEMADDEEELKQWTRKIENEIKLTRAELGFIQLLHNAVKAKKVRIFDVVDCDTIVQSMLKNKEVVYPVGNAPYY